MGRPQLQREIASLLDPGEEVHYVISALQKYWYSGLEWYAIVVTDRAIRVISLTRWWPPSLFGTLRLGKRSVITRLPRQTRLGPIYGTAWILVDGRRYWVARSKKDVLRADAELDAGT